MICWARVAGVFVHYCVGLAVCHAPSWASIYFPQRTA